jgi:hypothetical protein
MKQNAAVRNFPRGAAGVMQSYGSEAAQASKYLRMLEEKIPPPRRTNSISPFVLKKSSGYRRSVNRQTLLGGVGDSQIPLLIRFEGTVRQIGGKMPP